MEKLNIASIGGVMVALITLDFIINCATEGAALPLQF